MNLKETFFPDYLSQTDQRKIIGAVLFSIIAFAIFLSATPPRRDRVKKSIARLESYSNNVRYKESGAVTFYDVFKNEELQNNDEVFTGKNSLATVKFLNSQTILKIPSSSLVRIESDQSGDTIEIKGGLIDIFVKKDQEVNIKAHGVDHQVRSDKEGVVKAYYSEGELHFFTKDSGVKVRSNNKESDLSPNKDVALIGNKLKSDPGFVVLSPTPGQKLESAEGISIKTSLKSTYKVTLSKNADFSKILLTNEFNGTTFVWDSMISEGDYFLKVENSTSKKIIPISLNNKYKINDFYPKDGESLKLTPGEKVTLRWSSVPAISYKVLVRESDGKEKVYTTNKNEMQLVDLKGNRFEWEVTPETVKGKYLNINKSNQIGLSFKGKIEFTNPSEKNRYKVSDEKINISWANSKEDQFLVKILDVKQNKEIFSKQLSVSNIEIPLGQSGTYNLIVSSLYYPGVESAKLTYEVDAPIVVWAPDLKREIKSIESDDEIFLKYKANFPADVNGSIQISYSPLVGNPIVTKVALLNARKVKLSGFGQYCFKAILNAPLENLSDSDDYCMKYIQLPAFSQMPKVKDSILEYKKNNGIDSYKISVPVIPRAVKYHFEIYRDSLGKTLVYTEDSKNPAILWATNRAGIYYLKYKVYDLKNRESEFSQLSKLIFPISPLSSW